MSNIIIDHYNDQKEIIIDDKEKDINVIVDKDEYNVYSEIDFVSIPIDVLINDQESNSSVLTNYILLLRSLSSYWNLNFNSLYSTIFQLPTANWESTYTTVKTNSAVWDIGGSNYNNSIIESLSGNWNSVFTVVQLNSSLWTLGNSYGLDTDVRQLTSNWQSSYTTLCSNSSLWITNTNGNYLSLDGGTVNGDVVILSSFEVGSGDTVIFVSDNKVGINTETPNKELTIIGSISSNDLIYAGVGDSNLWNLSFTTIQSNSASNWNYQGTDIKLLTGSWDSVYTTVKGNSAEWESVYLDTVVLNQQVSNIQSNIITLDSLVTNFTNITPIISSLVNSNSANWDSSYTTVNSNSANWNYQGSDIKALTGLWDVTYNTVENNSSNWSFAYNKVSNLTVYDIATLYDTLTGKQAKGNYPVLDNDNKIPAIYLPGFVDDILEYQTYNLFPNIGNFDKIYVSLDNGKAYRWGGTIYTEIVSSPGTTDSLVEGSVNKYFTNAKAASAAPVQSVAGRTGNIFLSVNDITNLNTQLTATNVTTSTFQVKAVSQGVYNDGTTIPAGTSLETIIRNMLITRVLPTYNAPLLSVAYGSPSISTTYEVGFTIPTFTINPTYTPRDGGSLVGYAYLRNGSTLGNGSTFTVNSFQINSTTTLQVSARYGDGPIYNDNLGDPYPDTSIKANSVINTLTINTLYPYFYGKSSTQPTAASIAASIQAGTATKVLADANGTVSIAYNANGEFIWFAHIGTTKTKWYFTELNSGNIGNGNFINAPVTQNVTSPQGYWANTQYKIYISSGQTSTTGTLQFRNS
jgi:hypothetical protein